MTVGDSNESTAALNRGTTIEWSNKWIGKFSAPKTKSMTMTLKQNHPPYPLLVFDNAPLFEVKRSQTPGSDFDKSQISL